MGRVVCFGAVCVLLGLRAQAVDPLVFDTRGGVLMRPAKSLLSDPAAEWKSQPGARLRYDTLDAPFGYHRLDLTHPAELAAKGTKAAPSQGRQLWSRHGIAVKANRNYLVSALVRTDFERAGVECNLSLRFFGDLGRGVKERTASRQLLGLPARTEGPQGWQRLEWEVTVPDDPSIEEGRASIAIYWRAFEKPPKIHLADFALVELPARPLVPSARGSGVTFPGGVGALPMRVESAQRKGRLIVVETTGARFEFDTASSTMQAEQRIDFKRPLARWSFSLSLDGLRIERQNADHCILSNERLTIGIQADSMVLFNPHSELRMTLENLLGGDFNRYARGHLYSLDDFGGLTVNPYCPVGSGRTPRSRLLTEKLAFAALAEREYDATGGASPGWRAAWDISPGEFLATSVFPPRPYPWEESFRSGWQLRHHGVPITSFKPTARYVDTWLFWDYIPKLWGHSHSNEYEPHDAQEMHRVIRGVHAEGNRVMMFMSAFWTPARDAEVYIAGVRNFKEKYNIDGVYSDGLPATDWMLAYREMRMLRELFPDGPICVHDSVQQSRLAVAQFKPFLYTYATFNYMAEGAQSAEGEKWQYTRYLTSMYRKVNNLGVTKGDKWLDRKGRPMKERGALVNMVYNGRSNRGFSYQRYYDALDQLKALWMEKGSDPYFYDRYYLPRAQELSGYQLGRAAMPIVEREEVAGGVRITLNSLSAGAVIHYTTDGTLPDESSPRYGQALELAPAAARQLRARAFCAGLDPSAVAQECEAAAR